MNFLKTLVRLTTLLLCAAVFAGTAFAGDKPEDGAPGNSGTAPGQQKKAEPQPAAPAPAAPVTPPGQAKKADAAPAPAAPAKSAPGQEKKADKPEQAAKPEKAAKPEQAAKSSGSYKATSSGTDLKKGMDHKHTICHATGSSKNPYVVITPSVSGVFHGHIGHQGGEDIIPPFVYKGQTYSQNWDAAGQALFANGCRVATPPAQTTTGTTTTGTTTTGTTTTTAACPGTTQTVTEITRGGVFHKTGNGYVFIQPSLNSAHYDKSKHEDDIIVPDQSVTTTVQVPGDCTTTTGATTTTGSTTTVVGAGSTVTLPGETVTIPGTTTTVAGSTVTIPGQTVTVGGAARVVTNGTETGENEAGGVLGAQSPPGSGQAGASQPGAGSPDAGGVLGAVGSIGETAVTGTLPFTGIPLWIAALLGGGLLAAGFALRRTA